VLAEGKYLPEALIYFYATFLLRFPSLPRLSLSLSFGRFVYLIWDLITNGGRDILEVFRQNSSSWSLFQLIEPFDTKRVTGLLYNGSSQSE
jgi:hypothetical protein